MGGAAQHVLWTRLACSAASVEADSDVPLRVGSAHGLWRIGLVEARVCRRIQTHWPQSRASRGSVGASLPGRGASFLGFLPPPRARLGSRAASVVSRGHAGSMHGVLGRLRRTRVTASRAPRLETMAVSGLDLEPREHVSVVQGCRKCSREVVRCTTEETPYRVPRTALPRRTRCAAYRVPRTSV